MRTFTTVTSTVAASVLLLGAASAARANILVNGGLETGVTPNQFNLVYMTSTQNLGALPGWTLLNGAVDLVPSTYWQNTQGSFSVDMAGSPGLGTLQQTVTTLPATSYNLTFDLSMNPEGGPNHELLTTKGVQVDVFGANGTTLLGTGTYSDTRGTRTNFDMQYVQKLINFTSDGTSVSVRFTALTPLGLPVGVIGPMAQTGPVLDNVNLDIAGGSAPEPASLAVLGVGGLLLLHRRRRMA